MNLQTQQDVRITQAETRGGDRPLPMIERLPGSRTSIEDLCLRIGGDLQESLARFGAILFRGFGVFSEWEFQAAIEGFPASRLRYIYRSTPRHEVADRIYTATEYPKAFSIPLHNENSFQRDWPMRIWFCCIEPAAIGGNTPVASTQRITSRIDPAIRESFRKRKVMYVRNYGQGVDLPWEVVFQTNDRHEVEDYCQRNQLDFEWLTRNRLRTRQVCDAVAIYPGTRDELWFNQAHLFHISSVDRETGIALLKTLKEDGLPRNAFYGDGGSIEPEALDQIRAAYEQEKTVFSWERGDVLLLDNMLSCHGRESYEGSRQVLVAMTEPFSTVQPASQPVTLYSVRY